MHHFEQKTQRGNDSNQKSEAQNQFIGFGSLVPEFKGDHEWKKNQAKKSDS